MATIIEAMYEHGVLRPLATEGLKEQHRYRLITEESIAPGEPLPANDHEEARDAFEFCRAKPVIGGGWHSSLTPLQRPASSAPP